MIERPTAIQLAQWFAGASIVGVAIHIASSGTNEATLRFAARLTARVSFAFFAAAFFARSLHQLFPSSPSLWLKRNRRRLGLIFAALHANHIVVIGLLWTEDVSLGVSAVSVGWLALAMIAIMAATSNDRSQHILGTKWKSLHSFGGHTIAYVFALSFWPAIDESLTARAGLTILALGMFSRVVAYWHARRMGRRLRDNTKPVRAIRVTSLILAGTLCQSSLAAESSTEKGVTKDEPIQIDQTHLEPLTESRPSATEPFGQRHSEAPKELAQFAFLIGEFECDERIRTPSGDWLVFRAIWRGRYTLGGMAIQDEYWTAQVFTTSVRVFDPKQDIWIVDFYRMPDFVSSRWRGKRRGEQMIMRRVGSEEDGPTFSAITADGFHWHSGGQDPNWVSSCRRFAGPPDISK